MDLLSAAFLYGCCCQLLVVVVRVLLSELAFSCPFCIVHGGGGVPPRICFRRIRSLVVVVVVDVSSSPLTMYCSLWRLHLFSWLILSALEPCSYCRCRCLVVVVCISLLLAASIFVVVVFLLPSLASHCFCRRLVVVAVS